jgi:hypothetical protein
MAFASVSSETGGKRKSPLDVDERRPIAFIDRAGVFPAAVAGAENGVNPVAVAPGVFKSLDYERKGTITRTGYPIAATGSAGRSSPRLAPGTELDC